MKKLWVCSVVCGGLLAGISLTYARIIPGVDEPFDPANYYSTTGVSIPDSAPSIFTLRDLGVSVNATVFLRDYWTEWFTAEYQRDPERFQDFIIRDNYGSDYDRYGYHHDPGRVINVGNVSIDSDAYLSYMLGDEYGDYSQSDEMSFVLRNAFRSGEWNPQNSYSYGGIKYAFMDYIVSRYDANPEKYEKYLVQIIPGNVYDPDRHQRNILSCIKYDEILKEIIKLTQKKMEDNAPFGNSGIQAGLEQTQRETQSLNLSKAIAEGAEKAFPNGKLTDEEYMRRSPSVQLRFLNDVYRQAASSFQKSVENSANRQKLWEDAFQRSANAQGIMQAEQARDDMEALLQEEYAERNMLLENISAMNSAKQRYELTKEIVNTRNTKDANSQFGFVDPYHPDAYAQKHYEKPEPLGLPDF